MHFSFKLSLRPKLRPNFDFKLGFRQSEKRVGRKTKVKQNNPFLKENDTMHLDRHPQSLTSVLN